MVDNSIHICTPMPMPPSLVQMAAAAAIKENPANAEAHAAFLKSHGLKSMAEVPPDLYLALPTGKLWRPGRVLRVFLDGGSPTVQAKVQQYASQWEQYADIILQFVNDGPSDLRVTFEAGGSWSYIGTDNLTILGATMNYGWLTDDSSEEEFSRVVLHEFGHALGCIHEHQSPAAGIPWNRPAVYAYYAETMGWDQNQVDQAIFRQYSAGSTQFSAFDPASIMLYAIPPQLTLDGFSTAANPVLSLTDGEFINLQYPLAGFRVFHQGWGENGELWQIRTRDGLTWSDDVRIGEIGLSSGPSPVRFNDNLYVFHQGWGANGEIWYSLMSGGQWLGDTRVGDFGMTESPSAVVFGGRLYVFHQGWGADGNLWYCVFDGASWSGDQQVPATGMSSGPGAVVFQDDLYVFHQGGGDSGELWYNVFDGVAWLGDRQVPGAEMTCGPSPVVFGGALYVFHQGYDNDGKLWFNVFDGSNWSADQQVPATGMSASPSAATDGSSIRVFHQGEGNDGRLWCNTWDGVGWSGDQQASDIGMSSGPGAVWLAA